MNAPRRNIAVLGGVFLGLPPTQTSAPMTTNATTTAMTIQTVFVAVRGSTH